MPSPAGSIAPGLAPYRDRPHGQAKAAGGKRAGRERKSRKILRNRPASTRGLTPGHMFPARNHMFPARKKEPMELRRVAEAPSRLTAILTCVRGASETSGRSRL